MRIEDGTILPGYDDMARSVYLEKCVYRLVGLKYSNAMRDVFNFIESNEKLKSLVVPTEIYNANPKKFILKHKALLFASPEHWTVTQLIDACLVTIDIQTILKKTNYILKDLLPENISFDGSTARLIDYTSIVPKIEFAKMKWINAVYDGDNIQDFLNKFMLYPFFLVPIIAGVFYSEDEMRRMLTENYCNSGNSAPRIQDLMIRFRKSRRKLIISSIIFSLIFFITNFGTNAFKLANIRIFLRFCKRYYKNRESNYTNFYKEKIGTAEYFSNQEDSIKDKSMLEILKRYTSESVLDVGANTGKYCLDAALTAKRVIGLDIDSASVDKLYLLASKSNLPVDVAVYSFQDLMKIKNALTAEEKITRDLVLPSDRFDSETVLALGLVHHLVLGQNLSIAIIIKTLASFSKNQLILEFISASDIKILSEPSFFPFLGKNLKNYSKNQFIVQGKIYFEDVYEFDSSPDTRNILVFSKKKLNF